MTAECGQNKPVVFFLWPPTRHHCGLHVHPSYLYRAPEITYQARLCFCWKTKHEYCSDDLLENKGIPEVNSGNKSCTLSYLFYNFCYLEKKVDEVHVLLSLKNLLKKKLRGIRQKLEVHERNSGEVKDILVDMTTLASSNIKTLEVQQQQKS